MSFFVYILASRRNGTLYVIRRHDRQSGAPLMGASKRHHSGIHKEYGVKTLVWHEVHESRENAFQRERQIKKWNRAWKLALIEQKNPTWQDLAKELV